MTADLVAWLRACLAEDERECEFNDEPESWCDRAEGVHYDSRRVLAEVTAKRAILDLLDGDPFDAMGAESAYELAIAALLARPYADRAGFDPSWLD